MTGSSNNGGNSNNMTATRPNDDSTTHTSSDLNVSLLNGITIQFNDGSEKFKRMSSLSKASSDGVIAVAGPPIQNISIPATNDGSKKKLNPQQRRRSSSARTMTMNNNNNNNNTNNRTNLHYNRRTSGGGASCNNIINSIMNKKTVIREDLSSTRSLSLPAKACYKPHNSIDNNRRRSTGMGPAVVRQGSGSSQRSAHSLNNDRSPIRSSRRSPVRSSRRSPIRSSSRRNATNDNANANNSKNKPSSLAIAAASGRKGGFFNGNLDKNIISMKRSESVGMNSIANSSSNGSSIGLSSSRGSSAYSNAQRPPQQQRVRRKKPKPLRGDLVGTRPANSTMNCNESIGTSRTENSNSTEASDVLRAMRRLERRDMRAKKMEHDEKRQVAIQNRLRQQQVLRQRSKKVTYIRNGNNNSATTLNHSSITSFGNTAPPIIHSDDNNDDDDNNNNNENNNSNDKSNNDETKNINNDNNDESK